MQAVYKELLDDREFMYQFEKEYKKRKARKREIALYYAKQKLTGLLLVSMSTLIPFVLDGDATVSVIFLPLGVYLMLTREKVMDFKGK